MTVVQLVTLHTKPGASSADIQKPIKTATDLCRKHGAENVTTMTAVAAGTATGALTMVYTHADWPSYGKFQGALSADPETQALIDDPNNPVVKWDTYVFETIPDL